MELSERIADIKNRAQMIAEGYTSPKPITNEEVLLLCDAIPAAPSPAPAPQRFPDADSLLEIIGDAGAELDAEGLNLEVADRIYENGRQDGLREAQPHSLADCIARVAKVEELERNK